MSKTLSIITNFGCHYQCPYCVVKKNGIQVPKTTITGLYSLGLCLIENHCDTVSVSGGGDPLYEWQKHADWWYQLITILSRYDIPLEIHTSYIDSGFPIELCKKVSYHLRNKKQIQEIKRHGEEKIRAVFVVTDDMTEQDLHDIVELVKVSQDVDQISFRQRIDEDYKISYHLHNELKAGHGKDWWYIEQGDYNLYYAEGKVYKQYADFKGE